MTVLDQLRVTHLVFAAVDEVNLQRRRAERLEKSEATVISGEGSRLDSLGLVSLIFALEQIVEREHGVALDLADDLARAGDQNPFRTLGSLSRYVRSVLETKRNA